MTQYITIPLSKTGKYAGMYEAIVSPEDEDLAMLNWRVMPSKRTYYSIRESNQTNEFLHRVILGRVLGRPLLKNERVDHLDGNGLNNQRYNLRLANLSENARNSKKPLNNTSGYKGVSWHKESKKWVARIVVNNISLYLGLFKDKISAHQAYCDAADKYHQEFANHGSIPPD